jgi:hypothetical protein
MPRRQGWASGYEGTDPLRFFTDREHLIADFVRLLHEPPPERFPVIVYHDIGGQGKSTLARWLARNYCKLLPAAEWRRARELEPAALAEQLPGLTGTCVRECELAPPQATGSRLRGRVPRP